MITIDFSRARLVSSHIKQLKDIILEVKYRDPQYIAVKKMIEIHGVNKASLLIIANSLLSYQLSTSGEIYWSKFAEFSIKLVNSLNVDYFKAFLLETGNNRLIYQKLRRVEKLLKSRLYEKLLYNGLAYCGNLQALVRELANILKTTENAKTILFAAKMYSYLCNANNHEVNYGALPIPVDYRNSLLALLSCIITNCQGEVLEKCAKKLTSKHYAKQVQTVWSTVCRETEIPCLLLDNFTWLFVGKAIRVKYDPVKTTTLFKRDINIDLPIEAVKVLLECAVNYVQSRQSTKSYRDKQGPLR